MGTYECIRLFTGVLFITGKTASNPNVHQQGTDSVNYAMSIQWNIITIKACDRFQKLKAPAVWGFFVVVFLFFYIICLFI